MATAQPDGTAAAADFAGKENLMIRNHRVRRLRSP
jgi:hypothetical protein